MTNFDDWHKRYHHRILDAYIHMDLELRGAYDTILELIYARSGDVPNDERWLAGWFKTSSRKARSLVETLIKKNKIYIADGNVLRNAKADEEVERIKSVSRSRASNSVKHSKFSVKHSRTGHENDPASNNISDLQKQNCTEENKSKSSTANAVLPRARDAQETMKVTVEEKPNSAVPIIGRKVVAILGKADDPNWTGAWSAVTIWLAQGFDPELDIYPVVQSIVDRKRAQGQRVPDSLNYFSKAIAQHHEQRTRGFGPSPPVNGHASSAATMHSVKRGTKGFNAWIDYYRKMGRKTSGYERMQALTVPSPFPPEHQPEMPL